MDGFWGPFRGLLASLVWASREGKRERTIAEPRDAAIVSLADGHAALAARLQADLSEFLALATQPARQERSRCLHPRASKHLYGEHFELKHPIRLRSFSYSASASGGERVFKRLH